MPYDEHDESGKFTPKYQDSEFLDAVQDLDTPTTSNIAEAVGCDYRVAYDRLNKLEDTGRVDRHDVGNSILWEIGED